MDVDLLQFLGVWFIKTITEESFSLTRTSLPSLQVGIGLSVRADLENLDTMLVYFQHTPKNYIQDIESLAACSL